MTGATLAAARGLDRELRATRMFVGGDWVDALDGETFASENPYTGRRWATAPLAKPDDVRAAVASAQRALDGPWGRMSATERSVPIRRLAALVAEHAEDLAVTETTDNGKAIRETRAQMPAAAATYDYFAGAADKIEGRTIPAPQPGYLAYTRRRPIGVVAAILPWNSPLYLLANKLAPALAAGCAVVAKPAEQTPISTLRFAELFARAGFPDGVFNVVTGGAEAGAALVRDPGVDKVAFTGSGPTGTAVMQGAAEHFAAVTLELGGKSPNVVFADADVEAAANGVVAGIFAASGQTCVAGSRLLVHESLREELVERVAARARLIELGDPLRDETEMGPIAFAEQLEKVDGYVELGLREGAQLACGGTRPRTPPLRDGYFYEPTVLTDVARDMRVAREEIFGPVLSVISFTDEQEAVRLANDTRYGLAAGVWTRDVRRAHRVAEAIDAGTVWINAYRTLAHNVPFGGFGDSGVGGENGLEGLDAYLQTKAVWVELSGLTRDPFRLG